MRKPPKTYWNYRVATYLHEKTKDRIFCIIEGYYDNGKLGSYSEKNDFYSWEMFKDVKGTHKLIGKAFDKPIIDLDNFPNEYLNGKRYKHKRNIT